VAVQGGAARYESGAAEASCVVAGLDDD
jgi:hypothetical protein